MKESHQGKGIFPVVAQTTHTHVSKPKENTASQLFVAQVNRKINEILTQGSPKPGLYIIATPIGNLSDISLRALSTLFQVDAIYCEDTRHSKKLLSHYGIRQSLHPYHDHNARTEGHKILSRIEKGDSVALISDAGTPLISDPGYGLVTAAQEKNIMVTSLPGPSAVITALTLAGLPTDSFAFAGFLPAKSQARQTKLRTLQSQSSTLIFYESPKRILKTLHDIADIFQDRFCVIAKELTKLHETLYRGSAIQLVQDIDQIIPKGEFVILIAPPDKQHDSISDNLILGELVKEMQNLSLRDAVKKIAKTFSLPKKRVYALGLSLKK